MKRIIVHLIRGEGKEYHESLTRELERKFDTYPIYERIPPHLTLKRHFVLDDKEMDKLHSILDEYTASHSQSSYKINSFGNFDEDVTFLDVEPSKKMEADVFDLMDRLHEHPSLLFDEYDNGRNFHATLTLSALKPFNFNVIMNFLKEKERPDLKMNFDNVTILKKINRDKWVVDKIWELK